MTANTRNSIRQKINIEDAKVIVALVEYGTLKQASEALSIAGPAITVRVGNIESRLGFPVLDIKRKKGTNHFPATVANSGRHAFEYCRDLLNFVDENERYALIDGRKSIKKRRMLSLRVVGE